MIEAMDTEFLKTFLEVCRTRHFGKAAENLCISQSAVSARIRLLEETLGVPVFTRKRNDIQLTPAGQRLVKHAEHITLAWGRVRQDVALGDDGPRLLSVGAVSSLWDITLQDWAQWVYRTHSELALTLEVQRGDSLIRQLQEGALDLGFVFDAPLIPELKAEHVMDIPLIMVSTEPGQSVADALGGRYVMVDWGTAFAVAHAQNFPDQPTPRVRVELGRMALALIMACGGSAYLAEPMVSRAIEGGQLYQVQDAPVIQRAAHALYKPGGGNERFAEVLGYFSRAAGKAGA